MMNNRAIKRVIILGAIAIIGIIAMQSYWVISTWNINEGEFHQKVSLALYNVAKDLAAINEVTLPARDIVKQRTTNYYIVNVEYEINADYLEYFLQKEFEALALNIDFEYAVFDCHTNEMVYGNFCAYTPGKKTHINLGDLPKDNEFIYYFGVKFPTRSGYLFGKMQLSVFFSFILLVTTAFFVYSMWVILRQKRFSEMQTDFINNMTHEFKTPISTIKISAEVFRNAPAIQEDERLSRYADIIREQNQRLNDQVEKVLHLARIEGDTFHVKPERINLNALLETVCAGAGLSVEQSGGKLRCEHPNGAVFIKADKLHLTNIMHTLLDNAVKYCRKVPEIEIRTAFRNHHQIELSIADRGIGIPQEHLQSVFNKFFRVPTGNVHNVKGFGLGLYYVKNVCRAHGWKVRLESEAMQGTKVVITMSYL